MTTEKRVQRVIEDAEALVGIDEGKWDNILNKTIGAAKSLISAIQTKVKSLIYKRIRDIEGFVDQLKDVCGGLIFHRIYHSMAYQVKMIDNEYKQSNPYNEEMGYNANFIWIDPKTNKIMPGSSLFA